ncbi:MAG: thioredoxin [Streptosporangiaceae bacterium]|nr:thioredoxin [Streptosporangiaceae bacterium]MBV9857375.1 thioredoxin [Streptosporangiaceae bacterium]
MGAIKTVTDETFETEVLRNPRPVLVEFWAQWCGPCYQLTPVLEAIAAEHAGAIDIVKLNIDENPRTAMKYEILLVPTMNVFSGGEVVRQLIGAKPKSAILRDLAGFAPAAP